MRTLRFLVVAALAIGALAAFAPAVGASVPAASNPKFCKAVANISSTDPSSSSTGAAARKLAASVRKAAKFAPAKVRSALNSMADYYDAIGKAGTDRGKLAEAAKNFLQKYTKAFGVYTSYYIKTCVGTPPS